MEIVRASQAPQHTKLPEVPFDEEEAKVSSELEEGNNSESHSNLKLFKTNKSVSLFRKKRQERQL